MCVGGRGSGAVTGWKLRSFSEQLWLFSGWIWLRFERSDQLKKLLNSFSCRYRCCAAVHQTCLIMIHGKIYTAIARNFLPHKAQPVVEMRLGESNGYAKAHWTRRHPVRVCACATSRHFDSCPATVTSKCVCWSKSFVTSQPLRKASKKYWSSSWFRLGATFGLFSPPPSMDVTPPPPALDGGSKVPWAFWPNL